MTQWRWHWQRPLTLEELENRHLLSIAVGALGDSITAPYLGNSKGVAGDRSWAELLQTFRSADGLTVDNVAHNGATSTTLLEQGQHTKIAELVASGNVNSVLLFIGVNDVTVNLPGILAGNPGPFIQTLTADVTTVLGTIRSAGPVNLVVANIPDTGITPLMQSLLGPNPGYYQQLTAAITLANQQIQDVAAAYQVPVLDLFQLSQLTRAPLALGGAEVTRFLSPDAWHPGTVTQGIIANSFLAALHSGYGTDVSGLPLSDQEILTAAGIAHAPGATYLDVSRFVIWNGGNGSSVSQAEGTTQAPVAASASFHWAGFGQVLHPGRAQLSGPLTVATHRGTDLPAWVSRIVSGSLAGTSPVIAGDGFAMPARQPVTVSPDLLDTIFAEADTAFVLEVG